MEYRYIGKTGLRVSSICMGTMTFGSSTSKDEAFKILNMAYDRGINFFDTAELYPVSPKKETIGNTEKIVGEWLKTKPRDSVILATKIAGAASGWFVPPVRHGLTAIDSFHIKKAFDALVKEGKVRYIGTSNDSAYGLTKANEISKYKGYARFESIQNNFSLLNPRFHDELANVCRLENISLLPYSPMAGGVLSGKYCGGFYPEGSRFETYLNESNKRVQAMAHRFVNERTLEATKKYLELAKEYEVSPVTLAISYSKHFDFVASTIVGARKIEQLDDSLKAFDFKISNELLKRIEIIQKDILYPMG